LAGGTASSTAPLSSTSSAAGATAAAAAGAGGAAADVHETVASTLTRLFDRTSSFYRVHGIPLTGAGSYADSLRAREPWRADLAVRDLVDVWHDKARCWVTVAVAEVSHSGTLKLWFDHVCTPTLLWYSRGERWWPGFARAHVRLRS
jgi:hypothetical protein